MKLYREEDIIDIVGEDVLEQLEPAYDQFVIVKELESYLMDDGPVNREWNRAIRLCMSVVREGGIR